MVSGRRLLRLLQVAEVGLGAAARGECVGGGGAGVGGGGEGGGGGVGGAGHSGIVAATPANSKLRP